ncbi:Rid family hydrolase [Nocardioides houyundeii]|uniref:Rid family hydrolase n=1 Tax=Nocardioides houyundeii TaxID=2045452 RepID=UPI001963F163|nr:Rid family hydrolase [Nocardioides houyundeii]
MTDRIQTSRTSRARHRTRTAVVVAVTAAVVAPAAAVAGGTMLREPRPGTTVSALPTGQDNPSIADGVAIGKDTAIYKTSGLGPGALNTAAPAGTEQRYVDPVDLVGGVLPPGVTITEAQGLNVLRRIGENLARVGLSYDDVITMRVFLQNPAGEEKMDFAGWNRAYRQFFANTSLSTGQPVAVPLGTAPPAPPMVANPARPSRFALEIENLPVNGWLVEVEVDAAFPEKKKKWGWH